VQGEHVAVTAVTCFLCHFKDEPAGAPIGGCVACHPAPPRVVSATGYVVEHARYVADQVSCVSCHSEVTTGTGAADRSRCFSCHNEPERINQFTNPPLVHQIHITDHKVECTQCHTPIEHRLVTPAATTVELDCKSCHTKAHDAQVRLYAGTGGHNAPNAPSKMFLARVSCLGCHEQTATLRGHERVQVAGEASCLTCHGVRYASILPSWQREMDQRVSRVAPVLARARAVLGSAPPGRRPIADSLLRLAEENLDLVRVGKPAHNVQFADQLLRASVLLVREAVKAGGLPYVVPQLDLGKPADGTACSSCHLGTERATVPFRGGGVFPHEPHVLRAQLSCTECHTPFDKHGGTKITAPTSCQGCHHSSAKPVDCVACHRGTAAGRDSVFTLADGTRFPHNAHKAALPSCSACHTLPSMAVANFSCNTCHAQDHQPDRPCVTCHKQSGALGKHRDFVEEVHAAAPPCATCHDQLERLQRWSWQTCAACHLDQAAGHYEQSARSAKGCEACHDLKTIKPGEER
jgi:hypothetical protein